MSNDYSIRRVIMTLLLFCAVPFLALAQQKVSGKITSAKDQTPLAGISVTVKSTLKGTTTDADGLFTIDAKTGDVLVITGVGFMGQQVAVNGSSVSVQLTVDDRNLSEVVVTALGVKKEVKRLGYAVQEVKGSDLVKAREANPINSLVGKIAGLDVAINKEMLAAPAVSLRGQNITLYVVDGMPITSDTWNISPDDIETYTVLKGLAATAIYGSRAQNGAILITTKRGKANNKGFSIDFNSSTQIDKGFIALPKTQALYGAGERTEYAFGDGKGGGLNDGDYDVWGPKFDGQLVPQYDSPIDPNTGVRQGTPYIARGKDNLKHFIQPGLLTTNSLSFSGANDRANVRVSMSHSYQRGLLPNTQLQIGNFNINAGYNLTSKLKIEGGLNYNRQFTPNIPDVQYGPNSIIYNMTIWTGADWDVNAPDIRGIWQPGKEGVQSVFAEYQRYHNPWFMSYEWLRGHYKTDVYGNLALTYKISPNVEALIRANVSTYDLLRTEKMPYSAHPYGREENKGDYREDRRSLFDNNIEALVKYNSKIGSFINVDALGGVNARSFKYNSSFVTTDYLNVPGLYTFSNSINPIKAYSYNADMLVLSAYYSVGIELGKYLNLTTTGRVDKSSSLLQNNNTYFYPSVSAATVISDYINMPEAISFLKVRASYATAKSPSTTAYLGPAAYPLGYGAPYTTIYGGPTYSLSDPAYTIAPTYNNLTGAYAPGNKIDPNVKSSVLKSTEAGLDIRFLKNRLGFSATYYSNLIGPGIRNYPLSETSGLTGFTTNAVTTKLSGVELSLMGTPIQTKSGLRWDVLINWSTFKEIYKDLPSNFESYQFHQGDRVDKLYATILARTPDGQVINTSAGRPVYLPKQQYVGNGDVDWSWAINNKFSYKTFSISFQFDGKVGGIVQDYVKRKSIEGGSNIETVQGKVGEAREYEFYHHNDPGFAGSYVGEGVQVSNGATIQYDAVNGVITNYKDLQFKPNDTKVQYIQDYVSSFFNSFENTSVAKTYAKLREVVLTYSVPHKLLGEKSVITKIDISLVGRNLLYFFPSRFHDIDVDQYSGRTIYNSNSREPNLQTPTTRSYGFNVNVGF
ncbi:MAG: SusC/RagA family TonB-linked outer membrane protein [Agriterribacter sp.]